MNQIEKDIKKYALITDNKNNKLLDEKIVNNALVLAKYVMDAIIGYDTNAQFAENQNISIVFKSNTDKKLYIYCFKYSYEIIEIKNNKMTKSIRISSDNLYEVINHLKLFYCPCVNVAVFTGAFNPPTIAHKQMIKDCLNTGKFDFVVIGLSNQAFLDKKQKRNKDWAYSEKERLQMMLEMTYNNYNILIYGIEKGYTYEVLCAVKKTYNCKDVYFALGSDKLQEIGRWGHHDKLLKEFCFYIQKRKDKSIKIKDQCNTLFKETKYIINKPDNQYVNISATQIRHAIKNGKEFKEFIDENVYEFINKLKKEEK